MLEGCLATLGFCDEIVVVIDDRTVDRTEEIARRYTDKVATVTFEDFAQMRNTAIAMSSGDWILHVDADERVTAELARSLTAAVADPGDRVAFSSLTINFFWGRRMEHGGWGRMRQIRLKRREYARYDGRVHEELEIPAEKTGALDDELWHFSHRSIEEGLVKTIRYSQLEALDAYERGAPPVKVRGFVRAMGLEFGRRMVRRTGWRDGMPGVIEAIFQPFVRFCAQVMLWELQQGDDVQRRYAALEEEIRRRTASSSPSASKATGPGSSG